MPCPPPRDLSNPRIEPGSPALQGDSSPSELLGSQLGSTLNQGVLLGRWMRAKRSRERGLELGGKGVKSHD